MIWNFDENSRYYITIWFRTGAQSIIGPLTGVDVDDRGIIGGVDTEGHYRFAGPNVVWTLREEREERKK